MIEQFAKYDATVKLRRFWDGEPLAVNPVADAVDGQRLTFQAGWPLGPGEGRYPDEWAMVMPDQEDVWVASGDLVDIVAA